LRAAAPGAFENREEANMKATALIAGALCVSFAGAAMADEYYVVRNPTTHRCTVVTERPQSDLVVTQIGPIAFATRDEARSRIKQTKICTESTTGSGVIEEDIDED
jgi:hypothetical protein